MSRLAATCRLTALACGLFLAATGARAGEPDMAGVDAMPPYRMVRTLEYVQDSIVAGDHAAIDMQTYLLHAIDQRLRKARPSDFDDSRNADAALIYAMSGGNPETLSLLAKRDVDGHFDHALTDALLDYFAGQPEQARTKLEAIEPSFRNTDIGAYVTLVTANAEAQYHPKEALSHYDWVRLLAPGSILEESALRRSIDLAVRLKRVDRGIEYARDYARRFIHSPYAGQYADLLVRLIVDNTDTITEATVADVLWGMDDKRQAEIYLRVARAAALAGKFELARASATRAGQLSTGGNPEAVVLADFYKSVANVPSAIVHAAHDSIEAVPTGRLSARDQALKQAALSVAQQVTEAPGTTLPSGKRRTRRYPPSVSLVSRQPIPSNPVESTAKRRAKAQKAFTTFVEAKRDKLKAIDELLKEAKE